MKFLGKKGQGAMEYLMTYGWAILVVMIVGVVLWQLGIFNLGGQTKTMTGFGAVKPIDWRIRSASGVGDTQLILVNGEGVPIDITDVDLSGDCVRNNIGTANNVANGATVEITNAVASGVTCGSVGAGYKITVTITYNKTIGGTTITHTSVGDIIGVYE